MVMLAVHIICNFWRCTAMTISVKQILLSESKYDLKSPYPMQAEYITIHNTAMDAPAINEVKFMIGNTSSTSFHFAIDDQMVVQGVPVNRNAYHAGDGKNGEGNRKSIGIEICFSKSGGERYRKAEALATQFVAQLLHERKWGIDRVKSHKHWTEIGVEKGYSSYVKNCPHRILDEGRWDFFLEAVSKELEKLTPKPKPVITPTKPVVPSKPKPNIGSAVVPFPGILKKGSTGKEVARLQRALGIKVDQYFGPKTEAALKAYQSRHKLVPDGICGILTWNTIF